MTSAHPTPVPFAVRVDGVPMSGLITRAAEPRAVIVALHGGATRPEYFDAPGNPGHSLLRLGAILGFTVIAPDRPGYGLSRETLDGDPDIRFQLDLTFGVVKKVLAGYGQGAGIFLVGHSQGCVLAMRMAADPRGKNLLGLELAGSGVRHSGRAQAFLDRDVDRSNAGAFFRELLWEPARLYPHRAMISSKAPTYDGDDALGWPEEFAELAADLKIPVRISLGDHEYWWQSGADGLRDLAALFVSSDRVVTSEQYRSGHNISLGISARAYHLRVAAFVEECVLGRESLEPEEVLLEESHD